MTDIVTVRHESQNTEDNSHHGKENSEIDVKSVNSLMVVELWPKKRLVATQNL